MPYDNYLTKGTRTAINNTAVDNGKLRVATDTAELFFDLENTRLQITDFVTNFTEAQITGGSVNNPNIYKFYMASDSFRIYRYNTTSSRFVEITNFKVSSATNADNDKNGDRIDTTYAKLASPALTGTPTAPTAAANTDNAQIATTEFVHDVVDAITKYDTIEVSGSGNAITGVAVDSTDDEKLIFTKGATFLSEHPTITTDTDTTSSDTLSYGGTFTVVDSVTRDTNGHVTKINVKTCTMPAVTHPTITTSADTTSAGTLVGGGTFEAITSVTRDSNGHVTTLNTKTYTLPTFAATSAETAGNTSGGNTVIDDTDWDFGELTSS